MMILLRQQAKHQLICVIDQLEDGRTLTKEADLSDDNFQITGQTPSHPRNRLVRKLKKELKKKQLIMMM